MTSLRPLPDRNLKVQRDSDELQTQRRLSIAVLGPRLSNDTPGAQKRRDIHDALRQDGHISFYPEDLIAPGAYRMIEEERSILSKDSVDWIILLHTEEGLGTVGEIFGFVASPEITRKTTVFFPREFWDTVNNLVANTVEGYYSEPVPHTPEHLASCNLVAECKNMAADKLRSMSGLISLDFDTL